MDLIELVHILALVKQNLTVTIINDGTLDNRRRNDVLHFLGHDHGLAEKFSDGLEKIADVIAHIGGCQCLPALFDKDYFPDTFQLAHLGDKSLHDDDGDNRKQHFVIANVVQLKNDEASVQQVQLLVGVEQEVIFTATVIGFQHIQESPYIKILLTGSLLFQDILILVTDKFIEGIEGGFYAAVPADFLQKEIDRIG